MDYTNFVRTYYRLAINKLDKFSKYNGSFTEIGDMPSFPKEEIHEVERNFEILPNFDLNINAETKYFEQFLEFYGKLNIDLSAILLDKESLVELYNVLTFSTEDNVVVDAINYYLDVCIKSSQEMGVLA